MHIQKVQQWIIVSLVFTVGMIPAATLAGLATVVNGDGETGKAVGCLVMSAIIGMLTVAGCILIHARRLNEPIVGTVLIGVIPAVIGAVLAFA